MRSAIIITGILLTISNTLVAQENITDFQKNWPQFRGPNSNQLVNTAKLPVVWGANNNLLWTYKVPGSGWSSPVIWGNKVFVSTAVSDDPSLEQRTYRAESSNDRPGNRSSTENSKSKEFSFEIYCLDLNSGDLLWKQVAYKGIPTLPLRRENTLANETPVTDGKRVYVYFGMIGLYCYDFDGNLIWEKDLGSYPMESTWGASTSPLIYDDHLYMQIDNEEKSFLVDLDPGTGYERWRISRDEDSNWSTPVIWKNNIRSELVVSGENVRGYDPHTGELFWELNLDGGRNISSPVADQKLLYVGNEGRRDGGGTLFAVKAGAAGDITPQKGESTSDGVVWSVPDAGISMASPLLYKGCIYLTDRRGGFIHCYDAVSGKPFYHRTRIPSAKAFWATPWGFDNKVFCLDDAGTVFVIQPGSEFIILYKNSVDDKFWASPAFAEGTIILRGVDNLYCIRNTED